MADEHVVSALAIVATVVPTVGSSEAVASWRGSELEEHMPASQEWECLGYDVCDEVGISGLMTAATRMVDDFASRITEHHQCRAAEDADRFRAACDRRVAEHAPFVVVAV